MMPVVISPQDPDSPARIVAEVLRAGAFLIVLPDGIYGRPARIINQFAPRILKYRDQLARFLVSLARERA